MITEAIWDEVKKWQRNVHQNKHSFASLCHTTLRNNINKVLTTSGEDASLRTTPNALSHSYTFRIAYERMRNVPDEMAWDVLFVFPIMQLTNFMIYQQLVKYAQLCIVISSPFLGRIHCHQNTTALMRFASWQVQKIQDFTHIIYKLVNPAILLYAIILRSRLYTSISWTRWWPH